MAGNWVDTLKDRNAGLVPGFNPPDLPADVHERLARVDEPYVGAADAADVPSTAPRDARARALHRGTTTATASDDAGAAPAKRPAKRSTAKKATAAKKAR